MWCRFLTFCVLVSFILFVVASCIYGRPSFHLFFHRCCGDDIENDQVIYENFGNNFLKERLVGGDIIEADREVVFENEDIGRITDEKKEVSINDPEVKKWIADTHISDSDSDTLDTVADDKTETEQTTTYDVRDKKEEENKLNVENYELLEKEHKDVTATTLSDVIVEEHTESEMYDAKTTQETDQNKKEGRRDKEAEEVSETIESSRSDHLNVHVPKHKQLA